MLTNYDIDVREITAIVLGFLIGAVIPPLYLVIVYPLGDQHSYEGILATFWVTYPFSSAAVLVFGVPTFLVLRRFQPGHWWSVATVGFLLGALVAVVIRPPGKPNLHDVLDFGPLGPPQHRYFGGFGSVV